MNSIYEQSLVLLKRIFYVSALLFLTAALLFSWFARKRMNLEATLKELSSARNGLTKLNRAAAGMAEVMADFRARTQKSGTANSPSMILYGKVDSMKADLKPDEITISGLQKSDGEASLRYDMTFRNRDYNSILNILSTLHKGVAPLTPVTEVTIEPSTKIDAGGVAYRIAGRIITPEKIKQ